ncbi:MAG: VTT domain-containing protein [Halobacteriota archaeon]
MLIRRSKLDRAHAWFGRYGETTVFISRLLPIVRTFISLPAGVARMDVKKFSLIRCWDRFRGVLGLPMLAFFSAPTGRILRRSLDTLISSYNGDNRPCRLPDLSQRADCESNALVMASKNALARKLNSPLCASRLGHARCTADPPRTAGVRLFRWL